MKTLIVTGHTGFIGKALMRHLETVGGYKVIGLSKNTGNDLGNPGCFKALPLSEAIIHLAGAVGVPFSWEHPEETYRTNMNAALNMLAYARIKNVPIVYISSYVYGSPQYLPIDEQHPIFLQNPYSRSKWGGEFLCEAYRKDFGVKVTTLRPFNIYGPGQQGDTLIPFVLQQIRNNGKILVRDLIPKRDFLYIDDFVNAIALIIENEREGLGETYNLGFGASHSVQRVIDLIVKSIGKEIPVESTGERRKNEIMDCFCDYRKFAAEYMWYPRVTLEEGIRKTVASLIK